MLKCTTFISSVWSDLILYGFNVTLEEHMVAWLPGTMYGNKLELVISKDVQYTSEEELVYWKWLTIIFVKGKIEMNRNELHSKT